MKKSISLFLFFICLFFNLFIIPSVAQTRALKEGIYKASDLNLSPDVVHNVQNNSFSERSLIMVFDSKNTLMQAIRLRPQSSKYALVPFEEGYKMTVIGEGEATLS